MIPFLGFSLMIDRLNMRLVDFKRRESSSHDRIGASSASLS
jgi:hypothetical protein